MPRAELRAGPGDLLLLRTLEGLPDGLLHVPLRRYHAAQRTEHHRREQHGDRRRPAQHFFRHHNGETKCPSSVALSFCGTPSPTARRAALAGRPPKITGARQCAGEYYVWLFLNAACEAIASTRSPPRAPPPVRPPSSVLTSSFGANILRKFYPGTTGNEALFFAIRSAVAWHPDLFLFRSLKKYGPIIGYELTILACTVGYVYDSANHRAAFLPDLQITECAKCPQNANDEFE